jgi:tRNA dimethylallyltransferase
VPKPTTVESPYDWLMIGITIDKETLREKFAKRLTAWLEIGLLEEVARVRAAISPERFLELGFEYTLTADYIDKQITRDELFEQFVQKNWQYAKRQLTWLKRDPDIVWVDPTDIDTILGLTQSFLQQ